MIGGPPTPTASTASTVAGPAPTPPAAPVAAIVPAHVQPGLAPVPTPVTATPLATATPVIRKRYGLLVGGAVAALLVLVVGVYAVSSLFRSTPTSTSGGDKPVVQASTPTPPPPSDTRPKIEQVPRLLTIRQQVNQEFPVTFDADLKFDTKDAQGGNPHSFVAHCTTHFREVTKQAGDQDQNTVLQRLEYQDLKLSFEYDNNKDVFRFPDQDEVARNITRLATLHRLNPRRNQHLTYEMDLSKEVDDPRLKRSYANIQGQLTMLFSMLHVPVPGGDKPSKPHDTWTESWETTMSSGAKGQVHSSTNRFMYTYRGLRRTRGREEAVIRFNVELRTKGEEAMAGDGDGEAILDLKAAQISSVKLKLDLKTDTALFVVDGTSRASGTVKLELQRDLSGVP
jgi:hypothetical protein